MSPADRADHQPVLRPANRRAQLGGDHPLAFTPCLARSMVGSELLSLRLADPLLDEYLTFVLIVDSGKGPAVKRCGPLILNSVSVSGWSGGEGVRSEAEPTFRFAPRGAQRLAQEGAQRSPNPYKY